MVERRLHDAVVHCSCCLQRHQIHSRRLARPPVFIHACVAYPDGGASFAGNGTGSDIDDLLGEGTNGRSKDQNKGPERNKVAVRLLARSQ